MGERVSIVESHGSTDTDQRLINSKRGKRKSLVAQYICQNSHLESLHHQRVWAYFSAASLLAHSVIYWRTDIQFILPMESWSREWRKICWDIITQRDRYWRWVLQAGRHSHSHTHTQSRGQMLKATMHRHSCGPDMVEWSSQVKQMQSLWPEWMWHPEMWFTIIPPCPFYQFISPLCFF